MEDKSQKEKNVTVPLDAEGKYSEQLAPQLSKEALQENFEKLNQQIELSELIYMVLWGSIFAISIYSVFLLWIPIKIFGISFFIIFFIAHSLLTSLLFVFTYEIVPPLVDQRYIISKKLNSPQNCLPALHKTNRNLGRYWPLFYSILTDVCNSICLQSIHYQQLLEYMDEESRICLISLVLWFFIFWVSFYTLLSLGFFYDNSDVENQKLEKEKKEDIKCVPHNRDAYKENDIENEIIEPEKEIIRIKKQIESLSKDIHRLDIERKGSLERNSKNQIVTKLKQDIIKMLESSM